MILDAQFQKIQETFDRLAPTRSQWKKKHGYYYKKITDYTKFYIPENVNVLEVGSGDGQLLSALKPKRGLGIDASPVFVSLSKEQYPDLDFRHAFAENFSSEEKFDYIVLSDLVGYLYDVQTVFANLKKACHPSTKVVIHYYNYLWEPLLRVGNRLGLRMKQDRQNWLSLEDLENLLQITGYEVVKKTRKILFPIYIPLLSAFINRCVANLPFIRKFCLAEFIIAKPLSEPYEKKPSVSVIIACKNEKGNIEELVKRTPLLSKDMEMIFIDGQSTDGTRQEIARVKDCYPEKNIHLLDQVGSKGKGDAVRLGFEKARGEVFIVLDADISVAPEDIEKFYSVLTSGKGEMVNGTRMVYPMEKQAMRFLNVLGNKFFSMAFTFLLEQRVKDTLCGTKAFYKKDYQLISQNRAYFGDFDPFGDFDLLFGAAKLNLKIVEVPVRYYERRYGSTKIHRFRHGLLLLGMCFIAMRRLKFV